jgi:hypothetical protein
MLMVEGAVGPWENWGCIDPMACVESGKRLKESILRLSQSVYTRTLGKRSKNHGRIWAVNVNLRLVKVCREWVVATGKPASVVGDLVARLDSICPDGCEHDMYIILSRSG